MSRETVQQKFDSLAGLAGDVEIVARLSQLIQSLAPGQLLRMNPVQLASDNDFDSTSLIDLFVLGCKVGLFHLEWNLVCPSCACIATRSNSLLEVSGEHFFCAICNLQLDVSLDDEIEVTFALNSGELPSRAERLTGREEYLRHHLSPSVVHSNEFGEYFRKMQLDFAALPAGKAAELSFTATAGEGYRLVCLDQLAGASLKTRRGPDEPQQVRFELAPETFTPTDLEISPGVVNLEIVNRNSTPVGILLLKSTPSEFFRLIKGWPSQRRSFLSGKMILNNQTFRETIRLRDLPADLQLRVKDLTVLFTDLKGSTSLYVREGDGTAYERIQEHFSLLTQVVRRNSGAIVKTMGDAVMATFSHPRDGLNAACDMMDVIRSLNSDSLSPSLQLGLKIGLHSGPTLAVNANDRLDFFGQTVNIAARVQGLADSGQIWYTVPVRKGIRADLECFEERKQYVRLKGVGNKHLVFQVAPGV